MPDPITPKLVRRHRGKELILLRRLSKVQQEIADHNARYPQDPPPAPAVRRHLEFTTAELAQLAAIAIHAVAILHSQWPPPTT